MDSIPDSSTILKWITSERGPSNFVRIIGFFNREVVNLIKKVNINIPDSMMSGQYVWLLTKSFRFDSWQFHNFKNGCVRKLEEEDAQNHNIGRDWIQIISENKLYNLCLCTFTLLNFKKKIWTWSSGCYFKNTVWRWTCRRTRIAQWSRDLEVGIRVPVQVQILFKLNKKKFWQQERPGNKWNIDCRQRRIDIL